MMCDLILTARLNALQQNLERMERINDDIAKWFPGDFAEKLKDHLDQAIQRAARTNQQRLRKVKESFAVAGDAQKIKQVWADYWDLLQKSEPIFSEGLEVVHALAFRDKTSDRAAEHRICQLADELVQNCAIGTSVAGTCLLAAATPGSTLGKTLVRLIRMRFSDWTIWTLPFAAHELGLVIARTDSELPNSIQSLAIEFDLPASHVEEFCADVFAVYTMGPGYACSALLLRLQPFADASAPPIPPEQRSGRDRRRGWPADASRAVVILKALEWLDMRERPRPTRDETSPQAHRAGQFGDYEDLPSELKQWWKRGLDPAGETTESELKLHAKLERLALRLIDELEVAAETPDIPGSTMRPTKDGGLL